ncbi:type VII secretion-associated serine protease mycosin [Mycobacteroides abscessus]|uniref:type VII secretion-associated serine protease mycosin n=1 Tax=Mycobacteroides abscessus TaxID=36809 RepID=UPI0021061B62|nr:type VII secretion-associated serine protease mycosin [Mycobacteroides abscessus]
MPRRRTILSVLASFSMVIGLLVVSTPAAWAAPFPVVDPAKLPPSQPPAPQGDMRLNGAPLYYGAMPGFDPRAVPPAQAMLNLPEAWKKSRGAGVTVAVIDSGVAPQPRLPNLDGGGDYMNPAEKGLVDIDGHGTAVAGLIAGAPSPEDGFSGVAPEARILSIRQMSNQWARKNPAGGTDPNLEKVSGTVETLALAVRWAAEQPGVKVINLSTVNCVAAIKNLDQSALGAALRYAVEEKDIVVVAAAGNAGDADCQHNPAPNPKAAKNDPPDYRDWAGATILSTPSFWQPWVVSVGSLTPEGQPSAFSMSGPWVSIAAPGEQIVSLGNAPDSGLVNGLPVNNAPLAPINGTSYATAYVSGVVALMRSTPELKDLTAFQIMNRLYATAHNYGRAPSNQVGVGVIDPVAALTWEIPAGPEHPVNPPVLRVDPPKQVPPEDPWPKIWAGVIGVVLIGGAALAIWLRGVRNGRRA